MKGENSMLNLYVLKRSIADDNEPEFDATHGFVIAAEFEDQARNFAALYRYHAARDGRHRDESLDIWYSLKTTCTHIGVAGFDVSPGVILEDHQWG